MKPLLLISMLLALAQLVGAEAPQLQAQAQVTSAGVFLSDLATSSEGALPHLRIAAAPRLGQRLVLTKAQIEAALLRSGENAPTNLLGAPQTVITRRSRTLFEDEMLQLLGAHLQQELVKERGELELRLARPWADLTVPDEPLTVRIAEMPTSGVAALFAGRFEIRCGTEMVAAPQLSLSAKIWRDVWLSRSTLRRGTLLADAELVRERRDVLNVRDALAEFVTIDPTLETAEQIAPNTPLLARSLKIKAVVRRGQTAEAVVLDGSLAISMKVEVLEDGIPGQSIRIRNPQTRREMRGTVQSEQTIYVTL